MREEFPKSAKPSFPTNGPAVWIDPGHNFRINTIGLSTMKMNQIAEIPGFINNKAVTMGKITAIKEAFEEK